jgi:DNA polymerase bacteriophage-type
VHDWVTIDFETRSALDLGDYGAYCYAEHPTTEALCIAWQFPGQPVQIVGIDANAPIDGSSIADLLAHVAAGRIVVAHNAAFEVVIWAMLRRRRPNVWPALTVAQTHCTMAAARAAALPGALDQLGAALGLPVQKDDEGKKLMLRMASPRKPKKGEPAGTYWQDGPELRARLMEYCKIDVVVQTMCWQALPKLSADERRLWALDQVINARGVGIDRAGCYAAQTAIAVETAALDAEIADLTGGTVPSARAGKALLTWLADRGCHLDNLQRTTVESALPSATGDVRRALEIRQAVSKSSTAKLRPMLDMSASNGRARGTLSFHRATTGRWAGAGIQTQNLPRTPKGWKVATAEAVIAALKRNDVAALAEMSAKWGGANKLVANCLRSLICAAPGYELYAADYSNIEGRGLAWLAGEAWKLDAFRAYDKVLYGPDGKPLRDNRGEVRRAGFDLYRLAYSKSFGADPLMVDDDQRQIGKVQELALGYAGSIGAFLSMAANYNIDLDQIARIAADAADPDEWQAALNAYDRIEYDPDDEQDDDRDDELYSLLQPFRGDPRRGLSREVWAAIRCIVRGWRKGHPATVAFWKNLERAAIAAVDAWGTTWQVGPIAFAANRSGLRARLPSGRLLTYPQARVIRRENPKTGRTDAALVYMAAKGAARKWRWTRAYGGLLAENVTQAVARDGLAHALVKLEDAGFPVVMHVHDEIVAELPAGLGLSAEFHRVCEALPPWAQGLPLVTGEPWHGERYRK